MNILNLTDELHHVLPAHPFHAQTRDEAAAKELVRQHSQADRDDLFLRHVRFAQADDQIREPSACKIPYIETKPLHRSQTVVERDPDGSAVFQLEVVLNYELERDLISYAEGIRSSRLIL